MIHRRGPDDRGAGGGEEPVDHLHGALLYGAFARACTRLHARPARVPLWRNNFGSYPAYKRPAKSADVMPAYRTRP